MSAEVKSNVVSYEFLVEVHTSRSDKNLKPNEARLVFENQITKKCREQVYDIDDENFREMNFRLKPIEV